MTECIYRNGIYGYTCKINGEKAIADPITIKGEHRSGKSNNDVQTLDIENCDFVTFPKNLQELFPNLTHLFINNCHLEHIGTKHIGKLKKLTFFRVVYCTLRRLEGNLFSGLEELDSVDFSGNKIEEIEPEIIGDIKRLSSVNFLNNKNIDMMYSQYDDHSSVLTNLLKEIRVKCVPVEDQKVIDELQRNMQTLAAILKTQEAASKVMEEKLMVKINSLKLAQQNQNTLLDEHKKTIEELREKNACLSEQLKLSSDFTINVGGSIFKVNKAMFMARSPVIADLLKNNPETHELTLKDVKESTFKMIHDFIYSDQLPDTADRLEVFTAAAKLRMDDLKEQAAAYLLVNLDERNCFEVLVMSNIFEHEQLKQKAFEIIRTKIFPDRKLSDELMKQPEKLRSIIMTKRRLEEELNNL
jgi:hypothetical protein